MRPLYLRVSGLDEKVFGRDTDRTRPLCFYTGKYRDPVAYTSAWGDGIVDLKFDVIFLCG
jgi:hypothetical protein